MLLRKVSMFIDIAVRLLVMFGHWHREILSNCMFRV